MTLSYDAIPHLTSTRWEKTIAKAKNQVLASLMEPRVEDFERPSTSRISPRARKYIIAALLVVALAAFWISAGKQISAFTKVFEPVAQDSEHLNWVWIDASIVFGLALGEVGTILFSVVASALPGRPVRMFGRDVYIFGLIFRLFAIMCAGLAVLANVTITALHDNQGFTVFAWFVTLAPPIVVIGIGLIIESMYMAGHIEQEATLRAYSIAREEYEKWRERPDLHPTFNRRWYASIYEEITYLQEPKMLCRALIEQDGEMVAKSEIIRREIAAHEFWAALEADLETRPTSPRIDGGKNSGQPLITQQSSSM